MKRILMILLCLAIVLPTAVFAADVPETEVVDDSSDLEFAKSLGLLPEDITDETIVTRRILADAIASILIGNIDSAVAYPSPFADCTENYNGIYTVYKAGIMNGVGNGLFAPDEGVTYAQVIKVLVEFLGYGEKAQDIGGYPTGYFICAQDLDIIDRESIDENSIITAKKLASLLKKAQNADVRINISHNGEKKNVFESENYLSVYKGVTRVRGIITATHATDAYSNDIIDYYDVKLNDVKIKLSEQAKFAIDYLGYNVDMYIKDNGLGIYEGVYCDILDNDVFEIKACDMVMVDGSTIQYSTDKGIKKVKFATDASVIYNGTVCLSYTDDVINPFVGSYLDGSVKLVDNDGDKTYDYVIIDAFDSLVVSGNNDGKIYNKYRPEQVIDVEDLQDREVEFTNILGQPIPVDFPDKGDVISVSRNLNGDVKRLVLTVDTYTAKIKSLKYNGSVLERIDFDDISVYCSRSFALNPNVDKLKPGMVIKAYFNKQGDISDYEETEDTDIVYGYLVDAMKKPGLGDEYLVKIFSQTGDFIIAPLATKVTHNEEMIPAETMFDIMGGTDNIARRVVIYKLNKDGKINYLTLGDDTNTTPNDTLYRYFGFDGNDDNTDGEPTFDGYYRRWYGNFGGKLLVNDATTVFVVPSEANKYDDSKYYSLTKDYLSDSASKKVFRAYGTKVNSPVASMIVFEGDYAVQTYESNGFFVVDECTQILDSKDDEIKWELSGLFDGTEKSIVVRTDIMAANMVENGFTTIDKGDIFRIAINSNGEGQSVIKVFDAQTKSLVGDSNVSEHLSNSNFVAANRYVYGKVIYTDGTVFSVEIDNGTETPLVEHHALGDFKIVKCDLETRGEKALQKGSVSDLHDSANFPTGESMVFINTYSGDPRNLIIYID